MDNIIEFLGESIIAVITFGVVVSLIISYFTGSVFADYIIQSTSSFLG